MLVDGVHVLLYVCSWDTLYKDQSLNRTESYESYILILAFSKFECYS
jgi:hypothetical protein